MQATWRRPSPAERGLSFGRKRVRVYDARHGPFHFRWMPRWRIRCGVYNCSRFVFGFLRNKVREEDLHFLKSRGLRFFLNSGRRRIRQIPGSLRIVKYQCNMGGGQNLERRNVERPIFRNFKITNIKITTDELFDSFIFEFIFSLFINYLHKLIIF